MPPLKTARIAGLPAALFAAGIWLSASSGAFPAIENRQPPAADSVVLELSSYRSGERPAHRFSLDVAVGDPEIYRVTVAYPPGFVFGTFEGAADGVPGAFEVDFGGDGQADQRAPLVAAGPHDAFVDLTGDAVWSRDVEPLIRVAGDSALELILPFGGDANPGTLVSTVSARIGLVLAAGILESPAMGGRYVVDARVTSVDPETDGADDGLGAAPHIRELELPIVIDGPRPVPFDELSVRDFDLHLRGRKADRFTIDGHYVLGRGSNGTDVTTEAITLSVGSFRQTIPGDALVATGYGYRYRGRPPGIVALTLRQDGRFTADARRIHWLGDRHPVRVELQIGDDVGSTIVNPRDKDR